MVLGERLSELSVRVGTNFDVGNQGSFDPTTYSLCFYLEHTLCPGETRMLTCDTPLVGRYVAIHFPATKHQYLALCEVEVYEHVGMYDSVNFVEVTASEGR